MIGQPASDSPIVMVRGVHKTYPHSSRPVHALRGVDLEVHAGEFVALMGASGSGKSTLLHIIGGLDRADEGEIRVGGRDLPGMNDHDLTLFRRRKVGMIFQAFNLVATLTALENVALPMAIDSAGRADTRRRAEELLRRVGLEDRGDHRPDALSGGEQQRVAIARALLMDPPILLADEPTGNLDSDSGRTVWELLDGLSRDMNKTLLVVTHEPVVAARAGRVVIVKDGRLVGSIPTAESGNDPSVVATRYQELAG